MSRAAFKSGFSIVELITVLAIALLLGGILLGVGTRIKAQANDRLAESTIDILVCALEQYYEARTEFPFEADDPYVEADFELTLGLGPADVDVTLGLPADKDWSSGALYYFLHQIPNSRSIISAINDSLKTTKDASRVYVVLDIDGTDIDFMRFVDPWGRSFRYTYATGQAFPKIVSAGSDGVFDNGDDIRSRR